MEEFREEGEGVIYSIVEEIKHIHTLAQLETKKNTLKALFNALVEVVIAAHEYQARHPETKQMLCAAENSSPSDLLREEINRICYIDGGRALLEKIQEDALHRLDAYLQKSKAK